AQRRNLGAFSSVVRENADVSGQLLERPGEAAAVLPERSQLRIDDRAGTVGALNGVEESVEVAHRSPKAQRVIAVGTGSGGARAEKICLEVEKPAALAR